ncbi:DDE-type integrase/transposase/recombinase [Actinomyces respiraculi]|uniref:DDE-type integrase/transposase/recombinase n=1 Tax=Actinomyces respiraculi TaxID=2744574 RepID=UPI003CC82FEF
MYPYPGGPRASWRPCCTKKVVGYAIADHMRTSVVCDAIDVAARNCSPNAGQTIFHSDRGSQYASQKFLITSRRTGYVLLWGARGCAGTIRGPSRSTPRRRTSECIR